jgi:serine/threonine-protein kinase PpkA
MSEAIAIPGYSIERKLGRGGMAAVYLAIQQSFEREVALKVMSPVLNSDPSFTTRFMREARIVAHMHHASIVPVFDVGEHQPHHYLSMEYLSGGDLKQKILQGRCDVQFAVEVCIAVSSALDLAHRKGFVHRDVKPENILFREDGTPVLTDFGIARAIDTGTSLTMAGMLVGTPSYMSPEQVKGLELDGRSDLYSLGIVFYEMLTGGVPFRADSTLSVALKHLTEPLPRLPPELAHFQPVLARMTAKERDARYASGTDVIQALRQIIEVSPDQTLVRSFSELGLKKAPTVVQKKPEPKAARPLLQLDPRWLPWAGVAMGVIVLIAAFTLGSNDKSATSETPATVAQNPAPAQPSTSNSPVGNAQVATPAVQPAASEQQTAAKSETTAAETAAAQAEDPEFQARIAQLLERNKRLAEQKRLREEREAAKQAALQQKLLAEREQVDRLLAQAKRDYALGFMVEPEGSSAADRYREILRMQPQNADALAGMQRIGDVLAAEAMHAASTGNVNSTGRLIALLRSVQPKHKQMEPLMASLSAMESEPISLTRRQQDNLDKAARYIAKAHEFLIRKPMNLRMADAATDQYDKATEATPLAPGLPFLKERIIAEYAVAVRTELADKEKKRAQKIISNARERGWLSPELEQLESQINAK